jgi:hypothetical protein
MWQLYKVDAACSGHVGHLNSIERLAQAFDKASRAGVT